MYRWSVVFLLMAACSRAPDVKLSPRFAALAEIPSASAGDAILREADALLAPYASETLSLLRDRSDDEPLLRRANDDVARAIGMTLDAHDAGEELPAGACADSVMGLHDLGQVLVMSAPVGDTAQLEAALWLAAERVRKSRSLVGVTVGLSLAKDAVERLRQDGGAPTPGMQRQRLPEDLAKTTFAREALCNEQIMFKIMLGSGDRDALGIDLIKGERAELTRFLEELMSAIDKARGPGATVSALSKGFARAAESDSRLMQQLTWSGSAWEDLERARSTVEKYLALDARRAEVKQPRRVVPDELGALADASDQLSLVAGKTGVRVLDLAKDHAWRRLALENGDVLMSLDGHKLFETTVRDSLRSLDEGTHRLVVGRRGHELTLNLIVGDASAYVADGPEAKPEPQEAEPAPVERVIAKNDPVRVFRHARVADARALRLELEGSGARFTWSAETSSFIVSDVRPDTFIADLGFAPDDALVMVGDRAAAEAQREGQSGVGFLVDGLVGDEVKAMVKRNHELVVMRWQFQ